jgi:hypothetical protein
VLAFPACRFVEKVHNVSSKAILGPATFIKIEWADGIDFDVGKFAQDGAQVTVESENSLADLRHCE